jgi:DNA-binding transcriptional LysR family regulator
VVGTPAYFARAGVPREPADLARHDAVIYTQFGRGDAWRFRHGATEVPITLSGRLRVTAAEGVRAAVLADAGLAVASVWMFEDVLADGRVTTVLDDWTLPSLDLWAVFPTGRSATTKARAFVAFVEQVLAG